MPFKLSAIIPAALALFSVTATAKDGAKLVAEFPRVHNISQILNDSSLKTAAGREFEVVEFGNALPATKTQPAAPYRFLIEGGLHGNEEQASFFVLWLARRYARGESPLNQLPKDEVAIDFLPYANPDGSQELSRYNGHGVNLNRNFAVLWGLTKENPGKQSFSEPETKAIRALFQERKYTAAVDVHGYINWIVTPSSPESLAVRGIATTKQQASAYKAWVNDVKEEMRVMPGYQHKTGALLGDGGAFEDWAFWQQGTFAYCLEMETFQRFVKSYRKDFNDLTNPEATMTVDLFKRYEAFIFRTFTRAVELKKDGQTPDSLTAGR